MTVLGWPREAVEREERGRERARLKRLPWCDDAVRAHAAYESDCFRALLDADREPPRGARTAPERWEWRKLVYWTWRALTLQQGHQRRLHTAGAGP